jgi:cytochrome c oxidase subunit 1
MFKKTLSLLIPALLINIVAFTLLWARHTLVIGLNPFAAIVGLVLLTLIVTPLLIYVIKFYRRQPTHSATMVYLAGSFVFLIGALLVSIFTDNSTLDIQLHDTYFVLAYVHIMFFFTTFFLLLSIISYFFAKIVSAPLNKPLVYLHCWITVIAAYIVVLPVQDSGLAGMPRRYVDYGDFISMPGFNELFGFKAKVLFVLLFAQSLFVLNMLYSIAVRINKRVK